MIGCLSFQSAVSLIGGEPPEATVPKRCTGSCSDGQGWGPPGHFHGGEDRPGGPALCVKSSELTVTYGEVTHNAWAHHGTSAQDLRVHEKGDY